VLLDVMDRALGKMVVVDEPVELTSAAGIESNFDGSTAERCEKGRFEVALEIEHNVERAIRKFHGHFDKSCESRFSLKKKNFIDRRMSLDQGGACILKKPGDVGLGTMSLDCIDDGKGVSDISHCAEENDTDPWVGGEFHEEGKSSRHREGTSFSEKPSEPSFANLRRERRRRLRLAVST